MNSPCCVFISFSEPIANHSQLDYLISLKQQQVTVVQAWQSMRQGEDNQKQNITLLVFTVVTVVFVSFLMPKTSLPN